MVVEWARYVKPSTGGELEINDFTQIYLEEGLLLVELIGGGYGLARYRHLRLSQ